MFEYIGALHIHSVFSDGSGEVKDILQFANESGLDYIILTDHNTLRALHEGMEGWYGKTFLLVGCEINDKENKNHYLALGIQKTISTRMPALEYVKKVKEEGGIGFLAHPHEKRNSIKEHPPYPWTEWNSEDFTGIEIWNHMSEWMEGLTEQNKYNYFIHPLKSIVSPPKETLEAWDKLNQKRKVVGIGGVDAHAHKVNVFGFMEMEVFPYKVLFKSIHTHVLCDEELIPSIETHEISKVKKNIYKSLASGRCFISNYYYGEAKGFRYFAEDDKKIYQMGDSAPMAKNIKLSVIIPGQGGETRLIYNGNEIDRKTGINIEFFVKDKGVYRVEVFQDQNAWIFSNHIRIGV
jgi:hypothetical protein